MTFNFDNDNETRDFDMDDCGKFMIMILMNLNESDMIPLMELVKFIMFVINFL